jgi:hypothetical protein
MARAILRSRFNNESDAGVRVPFLRQDMNDRPVDAPKATIKRIFLGAAGRRRRTRMRVNPNSRELFGLAAEIDLPVE